MFPVAPRHLLHRRTTALAPPSHHAPANLAIHEGLEWFDLIEDRLQLHPVSSFGGAMSGNTTLNRSSRRMHFFSDRSAQPLLVNSPRLVKRSQALRGRNLTRANQVRAGECSRTAWGRNAPSPLQPNPNILWPCHSSKNPFPSSFHQQILVKTRKKKSVLRLHKLATIHESSLARQLGRLSPNLWNDVEQRLRVMLNL